jgi:hypothetical protein
MSGVPVHQTDGDAAFFAAADASSASETMRLGVDRAP